MPNVKISNVKHFTSNVKILERHYLLRSDVNVNCEMGKCEDGKCENIKCQMFGPYQLVTKR